VGTIERQYVADMREQIAERESRLRDTKTGVVAVVSGVGMLRLFEELGAHVIDGGPTMNPSTNDLIRGIELVRADQVIVLPNSKNVLMAAEEAARLSEREVEVVPSVSQQGALAALVEHDPAATAAENAARLREALGNVLVGAVAPAAKDDVDGRFVRGDTVGFEDDEVVAWGGTGSTLAQVVARLAEDAEIVTVVEGERPPIALNDLELYVPNGVELELHRGGQPNWYWLIAAQ
jgi:dihydroxyacetone kinase-like predicted kinase